MAQRVLPGEFPSRERDNGTGSPAYNDGCAVDLDIAGDWTPPALQPGGPVFAPYEPKDWVKPALGPEQADPGCRSETPCLRRK